MKFRSQLLGFCNLTFLGIFLAAVLYVAIAPVENKFGLFRVPLQILILSCALIGGLVLLINTRVRLRLLPYRLLVVLAFTVSFGVQLLVAWALLSKGYTWDSELVIQQAGKFALYGNIDPSFVLYPVYYPNNIALLSGLGGLFKLMHHFGIAGFLGAAVALNIGLMWLTQVLIYLSARLLCGRRLAFISILFSFVFISLSMYVHIPYTDTLTVFFPIALFYLSIRFMLAKSLKVRLLLSAVIGFLATVGTALKPTVLIALIAMFAVGAAWTIGRLKGPQLKRSLILAVSSFAVCLAACGLTYAGYTAAVDRLGILPYPMAKSQENSAPPLFFMAMGMKTKVTENATYYGGFDPGIYYQMTALPDKQARQEFATHLIENQLKVYGPEGYANFLAHKTNWILSDGTFYAFGEGSNEHVTFIHNDPLSHAVREVMYVNGRWYMLFGNLLQVFWIAILVLIGVQFLIGTMNRNARTNLIITMTRLMIAGIVLFLLLFEGRSRYLFLYVPIFIITALYTLRWLQDEPKPKAKA